MFNPTWLFVGAVYAAAAWLARRAKVDLPVRVAVFFFALVFVFFYLPLTQDYVNVPVDFLQTLPPWAHRIGTPRPANSWMNDVVLQILPWAHQVRESWRSLEPPLWNHLSAAGYPLLANAQSSALSPLRILTLPLSLGHAMTAEGALKLLIALTFTFLFCRRRGYSELASAAGAVAFGFSMFLIVWLHFPLVTSACLMPAVLYAADLILERVTYARFVTLAVAWAALLFGGHPETAAHTFFLVFLYVLFHLRRPVLPTLRAFFGSMAVAGLLAAPLLAPFFEALPRSKRYQELTAAPSAAEMPFSDWKSAIALVVPHFYGDMPQEKPWGPAHPESITGFAGIVGVAAWLALLVNVIATRAWRSHETFFVLATLLVLGVLLAWPVVFDVFHFVFRLAANARLRLILGFLLAIQTAALIDLIERGKRVAVLTGIAGAGALLLIALITTKFPNAYRHDSAVLAMLPSVAVLVVTTIAVFIRRHDFALMALLVAIIAELWTAGRGWNPPVDDKWMYPRMSILQRMDELHAKAPPDAPFRVMGAGPAFFPNLSAIYGYEDVRPHDPMANGRYIGLLRLITKYESSDYFARWNDLDTPFLDYVNVRYVMTSWRGAFPPRFALLYDNYDGRIYENTAVLPRFYAVRNVLLEFDKNAFHRRLREMDGWSHTVLLDRLDVENQQMRDDFFLPRPENAPLAKAAIVKAGASSYALRVDAPRYSVVVSSIPWWPGWKVTRNGERLKPIEVNGGFLGFTVPKGTHDVRVWYSPRTFWWGVIASVLTVIATKWSGGLSARRKDRRRALRPPKGRPAG